MKEQHLDAICVQYNVSNICVNSQITRKYQRVHQILLYKMAKEYFAIDFGINFLIIYIIIDIVFDFTYFNFLYCLSSFRNCMDILRQNITLP